MPQPLDQRGGRRIAAIDEHRADQRLADVGQHRRAAAPAGIRFRIAEAERRAEVDRARDIGAGLAPHQVGKPPRQLALVALRKGAIEHVGDDETEHMVAEKFQPLVAAAAPLLGRSRRNVGQRAVEDRLVGEE